MNDQTKQRIEEILGSKRVMLFMKGSPDFPQCGFSMRAVSILKAMNTEFGSFDILSDDEIRAGMKEFGNWPTFPQLWVDRQLVGGSDIMMEMWEQGELEKVVTG
ncbi:MAG: Grx4 family monothiol glutaredoxin [Myxococcota bacterium]